MNLIFKESRRTISSCGWCLNASTVTVAPLASREMERVKPVMKRRTKTS